MASDYVAIQDGTTTLEWGGDIDKTINFNAPGVDSGKRSVLSFVVTPSVDGSDADVNFEMDINGTQVASLRFTTEQGRSWQEIVETGLLKDTGNKLKVTLTDSDQAGSIDIHDFVLMYALA